MYDAIQTLKSNKAPGPDGFTTEFYKKFIYQLGGHLQSLFQACIDEGNVPATWREATIVVTPKPGKKMALPQSYHPISC